MHKKLQIASLMILVMVLIAGCASKPLAKAFPVTPAAGEAPVEAVPEDISGAGSADEGLDTSEMEDVDSILADIENI